YENYSPVAVTILDTLLGTTGTNVETDPGVVPAVAGAAESSRVVFPLPEGTWTATDPYGPRTHPITGEQSFHTGSDFAAPDGTPLLAAADGTVTVAEYTDAWGGKVVIEHQVGGEQVATGYIHSWADGIHVEA
ncbi:M23 family peptidase, partial [Burkholderia multivorans]